MPRKPKCPVDNQRRFDLIEKKFGVGLSPEESAELESLQAAISELVNKVAPRDLPVLEDMKKYLESLGKESES
jgi:hypothetical protein